ncbi:MAG: sigma-70 family RNA polymerase sigma factor [Anaerolineae bacterium]|nr:sigma-70 family RNA polymerase sigma factor [Anaerolineae bacterium]
MPKVAVETFEPLVTLAQAPDASLAQRHAAFGELVVRFQDMAYGYAYAILGDAHMAQDAAQEAFIAAYENLVQLREPAAFPGWLRRIVFTRCNRLTRGRRAQEQSLETVLHLSSGQPTPLTVLEDQEMREQIQAAIQALPEPQRMATVLYYIDGYSQNEVAEFLEVSVDAVKKRLQRARGRLQERMVEMVQENLQEQRPSKDDEFVKSVQLFSSLEATAQYSQLMSIEQMLADGVGVDARDENDQTLLHWAALHGYLDAVELLIQHKAGLNVRDNAGKTPSQIAEEMGHGEVADLLRRHGEGT